MLSLVPTPPANAFISAERLGESQATYPLELVFCESCAHVQLHDVVDPKVLFEDYVYVSGTSAVFVAHFKAYAEDLIQRLHLEAGALVIDIGSNDGTLLRFFAEHGMRVLGVDPARQIAENATRAGIETLPEFFDLNLARRIRESRGPAQLVAANNVMAHIDDLKGAVAGIRELLAPSGVLAFEVSYLVDVYTGVYFDTIYHEHVSYHTVGPLDRFFRENGMELFDVFRVPTHGGSLRGLVQLQGAGRPRSERVDELERLESGLGLGRPQTLVAFKDRIEAARSSLTKLLDDLKASGKRIAGYGAPAKTTTLLHHFRIGRETVDFIADDSPLKQGLYTPGTHIPVVAAEAIYDRSPDYLLVLAWNFAESIMAHRAPYAARGGRFIVPLPTLTIY